jgi:DNA-binding transcriptional LysR family regulator
MNLSDLEAFAAVVESGSIVGAAGRLYLTQSAVTKRIQNLEGALDVILLDRQSRPMRPTHVGKKVYDHADEILASVAAMKAEVVPDGEPSGEFNLGVAPGLGEMVVTPLFETLSRCFPKLVPRVFAQNTRVLLERLVSGSIMAGVLLCSEGDDPPDTLMAEVVGKLPYVLVGSQRIPSGHLSTIADLARRYPRVAGISTFGPSDRRLQRL